MYDQPFVEYRKICDFFGIEVSDRKIQLIIDEIEQNKGSIDEISKKYKADEKSTFRKGGYGAWRKEFNDAHNKFFMDNVCGTLQRYGYTE